MDTLLPDYHVVDGRTTTMINLPGHWILDDLAHFYYHISARKTILSCRQVLELYQEEFHGIHAYGGLFTLTMHPQASGRPSRVMMLGELIKYVQSFSDVWVDEPGRAGRVLAFGASASKARCAASRRCGAVCSGMPGTRRVLDEIVPASAPWSGVVKKGQRLRIVDREGRQAVDFLCYNAERAGKSVTSRPTRSRPPARSR